MTVQPNQSKQTTGVNTTAQPGQEERLRLLESAVIHARDGVLITEAEPLDEPGPAIIYANDAFCRMTGYTMAEVIGRSPRFLQGPQTDRRALAKIRQALLDRAPIRIEIINYRKDGAPFWVELNIAPVFNDGGQLTHFTAIQREITDLKQAEAQREQQLRYAQTLARCSQTLLAPGGTDAENLNILNTALYHLMEGARVSRAFVFQNYYDPQRGLCANMAAEATAPGIRPNLHQPMAQNIAWSTLPEEYRRLMESGRPVGGPTASLWAADPNMRRFFQANSILSVQFFPIRFGDMWWGCVVFDDCTAPREWDDQEVLLLGTAAEMIGNVLQRWQAEKSLRTANLRLSILHRATHAVAAAKMDLQQIYREIHGSVARLMPAEVFMVELIHESLLEGETVYMADRGVFWPNVRYDLDNSFAGYMLRRGHSLRIDDFRQLPAEAYKFEIVGDPEETQSGLAVLLPGRERILGVLFVQSYDRAAYTATDLEMLELLAAQAAITLENVQLYQQAQKAAVNEERHRLARDLHDAVTQTLFSASLIAEALPDAWERDPAKGRYGLTELRQLTRSALAEMRTLLLELRPASLTEKPLADSLKHLSEAMLRRFKIPFELIIEGDSLLPPDLQVAVYRIAQEALNNIVKHADADQVSINLNCRPNRVELAIRDDGRGFNPETVPPDHLGLSIMRERAEAVDAVLTINSRAGQGTAINLIWKKV
ncbi:MAG: PAS domain-containing protein [Anaerolineae bacterium]|nr:PAS domain-containing protein [Anaerolineae bacterium]